MKELLTFSDYESQAILTAVYPNVGDNAIYPTLGLCGESGEVAEKIKKVLRDKAGIFTYEDRVEIRKELGDALWYITAIGMELGFTLESIARTNIDKLKDRQSRNTLHGEGDNR